MGGMIAQELTLRFPARVRTLTSVMSTTGADDLPTPYSIFFFFSENYFSCVLTSHYHPRAVNSQFFC